jgi:hypothetical protein
MAVVLFELNRVTAPVAAGPCPPSCTRRSIPSGRIVRPEHPGPAVGHSCDQTTHVSPVYGRPAAPRQKFVRKMVNKQFIVKIRTFADCPTADDCTR